MTKNNLLTLKSPKCTEVKRGHAGILLHCLYSCNTFSNWAGPIIWWWCHHIWANGIWYIFFLALWQPCGNPLILKHILFSVATLRQPYTKLVQLYMQMSPASVTFSLCGNPLATFLEINFQFVGYGGSAATSSYGGLSCANPLATFSWKYILKISMADLRQPFSLATSAHWRVATEELLWQPSCRGLKGLPRIRRGSAMDPQQPFRFPMGCVKV